MKVVCSQLMHVLVPRPSRIPIGIVTVTISLQTYLSVARDKFQQPVFFVWSDGLYVPLSPPFIAYSSWSNHPRISLTRDHDALRARIIASGLDRGTWSIVLWALVDWGTRSVVLWAFDEVNLDWPFIQFDMMDRCRHFADFKWEVSIVGVKLLANLHCRTTCTTNICVGIFVHSHCNLFCFDKFTELKDFIC